MLEKYMEINNKFAEIRVKGQEEAEPSMEAKEHCVN